jgi:glycerate 2-kinase
VFGANKLAKQKRSSQHAEMSDPGRHDAIAIWKAAVAAVDSERLIDRCVRLKGDCLHVDGRQYPLSEVSHIEVVGAGKAGAGMARGLESILKALPVEITWSGWINVPEDCVDQLDRITLHPARPAGINEPTDAGIAGTREILKRVSRLKPTDLCLVALSGGGSALLPAPAPGISLADKLAVTRLLAAAGASIQELNAVRGRISQVKCGGLARACTAARLVSLIISDVIGDPLDIIASGPTHVGTISSDPYGILKKYDPGFSRTPASIVRLLQSPASAQSPSCDVDNHIIGSNQVAIAAASQAAKTLGYDVICLGSENDGSAAELGRRLWNQLHQLRENRAHSKRPVCVLAGGETTVQLNANPGKGGRNQSLVLSAIAAHPDPEAWDGITLLSGGTDGEDGPTPSAGAFADPSLVATSAQKSLDPLQYLTTNNAWPFFNELHGLLNTGPTHTNVMDVQVGLVRPTPE